MRILIINPYGIGDVLFTTPLIANLKEAIPDCFIGYVCNARTKDILLNNPKVDRIFVYEKDQFRKLWNASRLLGIRKFSRLFKSIKRAGFDAVLDLSLGQEYGFLLWLMGIKKRIGYDYKNRGIFLTDKISIDGYENKHMAEYYLELARFLGIEPQPRNTEFPLGAKELQWAGEYMKEHQITEGDIVIGVVPGGGASWGMSAYKKRWPQHRFANLANQIIERYQAKIILFGDAGELPLCNQVASLIKGSPVMACGMTSLSKLAALMRKCDIVVCNDGGPLHIAVSQGARSVSIFGPVDPEVYGPYPKSKENVVIKKEMVCRPCYRKFKLKECVHADCLTNIEVAEVLAAIDKFLSEDQGGA